MSIERNTAYTKIAEEIVDLIEEIMGEENLNVENKIEVCNRVIAKLRPVEPKKELPEAGKWTYEKAKKWAETTQMAFEMHAGSKIRDIPKRYLEWLSDQPDFRRDLLRYVESEYFERAHQ